MSADYNSRIVIGISLSQIMNIITKPETFEVHDKRGNKTGNFETEIINFLKYQNKEIKLTVIHNHVSIDIDEVIELIFGKYDDKYECPHEGFGISHTYSNETLEDFYIGWHTKQKNLSLEEITKLINDVKSEFEHLGIFNVNIEVHFLAYIS